jgi:glyoxylase-like metal-dependent hydrolase (beta-lactamase superfamily II)
MNSVVLADPEHTVIVDPGVLPSELDDLAGVVRAIETEVITLFFTHAHWDHVLGRPWWPNAKTLAHDRFATEVHKESAHILGEAQACASQYGEGWSAGFAPFAPDVAVSGQHFTKLGPWRVVFRDAPGHSASQLTCHLADLRFLLAADVLSDIEPPLLDGPPSVYRATLETLLPLADHGAIETLIPGHGAIARGRDAVVARFQADLGYLAALERGVEAALAQGLSLAAAQESLAAMDYNGRGSPTQPADSGHRDNIAFSYQALEATRERGR